MVALAIGAAGALFSFSSIEGTAGRTLSELRPAGFPGVSGPLGLRGVALRRYQCVGRPAGGHGLWRVALNADQKLLAIGAAVADHAGEAIESRLNSHVGSGFDRRSGSNAGAASGFVFHARGDILPGFACPLPRRFDPSQYGLPELRRFPCRKLG